MKEPRRRRFLQVISASAAGLAAVPACGDRDPTTGLPPETASSTGNTSSTGSAGGAGASSSSGTTSGGEVPDTLPANLDVVGHIDDFGNNTLIEAETYQFYLGRDAGGVYCLGGFCTHNNCAIKIYGSITSTGLDCGCHGSEFGFEGEVLKGPATKDLPTYYVLVDAQGNIGIDRFMEVDVTYRANVPA